MYSYKFVIEKLVCIVISLLPLYLRKPKLDPIIWGKSKVTIKGFKYFFFDNLIITKRDKRFHP